VTVFIDTAVIMYAAGAEHPLREPSRRVLSRIGTGELDGVISVEVIQEILHRFSSIRRRDVGEAQARDAMDFFAPVLPITHALMRRVPDLAARYPSLAARDLIHVATCVHEGITEIISPDRGFDGVAEVRRIDPAAFGADPA
jgi:predicted nucleic acid-binding protein